MANKKTTRRALFMSIISLLLCCSMLVGTTFAWFTDEVKSGKNTITAGNLDIELEYSKTMADNSWTKVNNATDLINPNALWEPGHTEVVYLRMSNIGTLALDYKFAMTVANAKIGESVLGNDIALADHLKYDIVEVSSAYANRSAARTAVENTAKTLATYTDAGQMDPKDVKTVALVVYMPDSVGNEANYRGNTIPSIDLGINLLASQQTKENDSFGSDYDAGAMLPIDAGGEAAVNTNGVTTVNVADKNNKYEDGRAKIIATLQIPAAAIADGVESVSVDIDEVQKDEANVNITVAAGKSAKYYNVTVSGVKEGNTAPITVELDVGIGVGDVEVYHYDQPVEGSVTYNKTTGKVTFTTTSFSPFTVVYKAAATPVEPTVTDLPQATVEKLNVDDVNAELDEKGWSVYGSFRPANLNQRMEVAYLFEAKDTAESVEESKYADWNCDFYVSMDRDVSNNTVCLGGNYGSFGWIGFMSGEDTIPAGTEIGLLATAVGRETTTWTYRDIVNYVGTFRCGVARAIDYTGDALNGATFTVKLRLINPENANEFHDIETIHYTFQ